MPLSVLTLNIWNDDGPWDARAALIRDWIRRLDPDLIGLQEVLRGPGRDQLEELFDGTSYHTDYVATIPFWNNPELSFGNAVASRWPVRWREVLRLPDAGDAEKRSALTVGIDAPLGEIAFTCTHLNWRLHHGIVRQRQVVALAEEVLRLRPRGGFPPIVVGDFNAEPDSDEIRFMTGLHALQDHTVHFRDAWRVAAAAREAGITWSNDNPYAKSGFEPDRRLDYIFVGYPTTRGMGWVSRCQLVCNEPRDGVWPSDHFGVYAELLTEPSESSP